MLIGNTNLRQGLIQMTAPRKCRRQLYKKSIVDIALDISQSDFWRKLLSSSGYDKKFLINSNSEFYFPNSTKALVIKHNLQFYVSKVKKCPIRYMMKDGFVIFKFQSLEFPEVVQYSGN